MTQTYEYNGQTIDYNIIYKKRKTIGIYIDIYGQIELRVPRETTDEQIQEIIEKKWKWILSKSVEQKEKTKGFKPKEYVEGETFLFLGKEYPISIEENPESNKAVIGFENDVLQILVPEKNDELFKKLLSKFYKQQCKRIVESRIQVYQKHFKMKPRKIKILSNKKTWGTCNSQRELTFNWKLAMAPMEVVDYVVVHEMCHMVHMNHDRSFWRLVGKYIPDYEERQEWLKNSYWKMVV